MSYKVLACKWMMILASVRPYRPIYNREMALAWTDQVSLIAKSHFLVIRSTIRDGIP